MDKFIKKPVDVFKIMRRRKLERIFLSLLILVLSCFSLRFFFMSSKVSEAELFVADTNSNAFNLSVEPKFTLNTKGAVRAKDDQISHGEMKIGNQKIKAVAFSLLDENENITPTIVANMSNPDIFEIRIPKSNDFSPGKYKLSVDLVLNKNQTQTIKQDFVWGVLALNVDQTIYQIGQTARISMGVLDESGKTICDADLSLSITDPNNQVKTLSTGDKSISMSDVCSINSVADLPDYSAAYKITSGGTYKLSLKAKTMNGQYTIQDSFIAEEFPEFLIKRSGATRIYPLAKYSMKIDIEANINHTGPVIERVPKSFAIDPDPAFTVSEDANSKLITWKKDFTAEEDSQLTYTYKAPEVSPEFYLVGPLEIGPHVESGSQISQSDHIFKETREWQIASDADYLCTWNGSSSNVWELAANWTNCNSAYPSNGGTNYYWASINSVTNTPVQLTSSLSVSGLIVGTTVTNSGLQIGTGGVLTIDNIGVVQTGFSKGAFKVGSATTSATVNLTPGTVTTALITNENASVTAIAANGTLTGNANSAWVSTPASTASVITNAGTMSGRVDITFNSNFTNTGTINMLAGVIGSNATSTFSCNNATRANNGFYGFRAGGTTATTTLAGSCVFAGAFTITTGNTLVTGTGTHEFTRSSATAITNSGTFTASSGGTIILSGSVAGGTIAVSAAAITFDNLQIGSVADANAMTYTLGANTIINSTLKIGALSGTTHTLDATTRTLTLTGSGVPLEVKSSGAFTASTSTVKFNGTGAVTIPALTYNNLQTVPTADNGAYLYSFASGSVSILGNYTNGDGAHIVDTSALANNATLNVDGNFTNAAVAIFRFSTLNPAYIAGNLTNSATGQLGTSNTAIYFDGSAAQTITAAGTDANHDFKDIHVTNSSSGGVIFADSLVITGTFNDTTSSNLTFNAGSTYTFANLNINPSSGTVVMRSSINSSRWSLVVSQATPTVHKVDVKDSDASGGNPIDDTDGGINSQNNLNWTFPATGISISGTIFDSDTNNTTPLGANKVVGLSINGASPSTSLTDAGGNYIFSNITLADNAVFILYLKGNTEKGSFVYRCGTSNTVNLTSIQFNQNAVKLNHTVSVGMITNADMDQADFADSDIGYSVSAGVVTVNSGMTLLVRGSRTYAPGSTTIANDINIGGTLSLGTHNLTVHGGWTTQLTGSFSASAPSVVTFDSSTTGNAIFTNGSHFASVTFNNASGGWFFTDNAIIDGSLAVTAGTLSGTHDISVMGGAATGAGTVNLTGGTFLLDGTGGLGGGAGWTFYNLTLGDGTGTATTSKSGSGSITTTNVLTVAANQSLNCGTVIWIFSGIGTPVVVNGSIATSSSTFSYTGDGDTNVIGGTFAYLRIGADSTPTKSNIFTLLGDLSFSGQVVIGPSSSAYTQTLNASSKTIHVANSGTNILLVRGGGGFNPSTSTVIYEGTAASTISNLPFYNLNLTPTSGTVTYTLSGHQTGSNAVQNTLTISANATLSVGALNYNIEVGNNWSNSGTFTAGSGTVTFTATSLGHTITDGGSNWNNVTFNGSGGGWSFSDSTVMSGDLTMTAGTLSGTNSITVNGGDATGDGTINLTGGTFLLDGVGNFGGTTNWSFSTLNFGDNSGTATTSKTGTNTITLFYMTIGFNQTLDADDDTWNLNGNTTSYTINGIFDEDVSTFRYAGGPTQYITSTTYNNLVIDNVLGAFELFADMTIKSTLTLTSGQLNLGNGTTTLLSTGSPISIGSGTLEPNGSTLVYAGVGDVNISAIPCYNLELKPTSDASTYTYSLPTGTLTVYNNFTVGDGTNAVVVDANTNDTIVDIGFGFSIDETATFIASNSAAMYVGGWFYITTTGTFTHSSNTVTLDGPSSQFINLGGSTAGHTFNNLVVKNTETSDSSLPVTGNLVIEGNLSIQTTNTGFKYLDCATNDPNVTLGGNLTFSKSSTGLVKLDMGDGTWTVAGDMDFRNGTVAANGSTLVTTGSYKTIHGSNITLNNLKVSNNTSTDDHWAGSIGLSGTLTVDIGKYFYVGAGQTFRMNAGSSTVLNGDVSYGGGGAYVSFIDSASANISGTGHLYPHSVFVAETSDITLSPRTFDSWLMFVNNDSSNSNHTITLGTAAGQSFTSGLIKLQANYGGNLTIDGSVNNPNMYFYGLTYDGIGSGTEYLKLGNGSWTSEGDVTFPAGTDTVVPGNSTFAFRYTGTFNPNGQTLHNFIYWASNPHRVTMAGDLHVNGNMVIDTNWETATFDNSVNDNNITIDGNLSYGNSAPNKGTLLMGDGTWKVGGSVNLSGMTVTAGNSTLELNGTDTQSLTASSQPLYNLSVTNASVAGVTFADSATVTGTFTDVTASSKLTFDALSTYAFANININGQATGTKIVMVSNDPSNADLPSRQWYLNVTQSSPQASFVNVTDSDANGGNAIAAASSTNAGNNENWIFGINISGTVYTVEDKSNNIGAGKTVALSINGAAATTVETTTGGAFSISTEVSANNTIAIFLSGEAEKASYITQGVDSATDITGLELYASHIVLTYNTAGPMTNSLLATVDDIADTDLLVSVSGSDATFTTGNEVWILGGKIYTPGGNVMMGSLDILSTATFSPESNTITFTDSGTPFSINGTFNGASATIAYTGSSATSVTGTTYNNLTVNHTGTTFTSTGDSTVRSVFTILAGTFDASDDTLTLSGSGTPFVNNGTFIESTSHIVYSGTGATSITGSTYNDLTLTNGGYYKAFSITNGAGVTLTDYQIKVDLNASNFDFSQSTSDGRDIRFYDNDNNTALSYYINSWNQVGQTAVIWVKVPSIPTGGTTVYIHFGDINLTSASSGDNTFMFFDDFSGSSIDTAKWPSHSGETVGSGTATLNVSTDSVAGEDYIWATDYAVPIGSVVDIRSRSAAVNSKFRFGMTDTRTTFYANSLNYFGTQQYIDGNAYSDINAAGTLTQDFAATYDANWHNYSFAWSSNSAKYFRDGTLLKSYTSNVPTASASMHPYARDDGLVDSVWVRKYASTEPTLTAGQTLSSKVAAGSITARGVFNISQGAFDASDKTITLSGDATPFVIGGTFVSNTSTILYDGSSAVNVTGTTYYNLTFDCADTTFTSAGNTTVNHVLNLINGTFDASDDSLVLAGAGTPMVVGGTFNPSTSTLTYLGSGVINIAATSYYNLLLDNATGEFFGGSSAITVSNNITLAQGQFTSTSDTLSIAGNWVGNSTFVHNSGTVDFTKDSGTQTLTQYYGSGDFYNLVHSGSGILQFSSDWSFYKEITVSHTVVTGSDQSSFPILVSLSSDVDLAAAAQSDGDDIYFSDTSDQKLDHQIEKYVSATGELKAWVRIPTLSATNDTVIKMHYGNAGCASQQNIAAVWSNGFEGVWHMGEATNGQVLDSSDNGNNSVAANTTQVPGQIGNSQSFDGSSQYVNLGGGSTLRPAKISVSAWVKTNGNQDGYDRVINVPYSTTDASWELSWNRSGSAGLVPYFGMRVGSSVQNGRLYNSSVSDNSWTYLTSTWDGSSSHNYINASASDGSLVNGSASGNLYYEGTPQNAFVSTWKGSSNFGKYNGIDEIRVSSVARTADWIATEYKNQSNPTSYQTVGDETYSTIVIAGALTQSSSGSLDTNGFKVAVSGLATISGGEYLALSSEQIFDGGLTISGGIYSGSTGATDVNGAVVLSSGTLTAPSGAFNVSGNWTKSGGTFTAGSNSLIFDGVDSQTVTSGGASFNNLTVTNASVAGVTFADSATVTGTFTDVTASSKLTFDALSTYAFANININGQATGTKIVMVSNDPSNADLPSRQWYLNVTQSSPQASFVNVTDSDANGGNAIAPITSTNGGNNENWQFNQTPNTPSSLLQKKVNGGASLATGDWTNENQVTFSATASDPDTSDTLSLCVEKAAVGTALGSVNGGDLCGTGVAYSGTPITVSVTITGLADATEFHWQAQVKDNSSAYSSFVDYGSNTENPPTNPASRDFGVDTTAPTGGLVNDGTTGDQDLNDGTLNSISANWSGFDATASGLSKYEYAVRRSSDGWYWDAGSTAWQSGESWVDNSTAASATVTPVYLNTGDSYYFSVKTTDNAGNTTSAVNSNGQEVLPTLSFFYDSNIITFSNLNNTNDWTDVKSTTITTSTNASSGYSIYGYINQLLTSIANPTISIPNFSYNGASWASPQSWSLGEYGFGYTSSDTSVAGSNRFSGASKYSPFQLSSPGDVVADHTDAVNGQTGKVNNEEVNITYKVSASQYQSASDYRTFATYVITANF